MKKIIIILIILFFSESYSNSVSINFNNNQILLLKQKNDSLTKRLDQIEKNDYKSIEVIEKVNDFYDKSWNKLIVFLSIAGSIILFVIPYLLARNQEEKIQLKTTEFEDLMNRKVNELELKIIKFHQDEFELLKNEISLTQDDLNTTLAIEIKFVRSYIFALRGMISEKNNDYSSFFKYYIISLNLLIGTDKTKDIESMIIGIIERIKTSVTKELIINKSVKSKMEKLISSLEDNYSEAFGDIIEELKDNNSKLTYQ